MPKIFIPSINDLIRLESDWSFIIDFNDPQNEQIDKICREAEISGDRFKSLSKYIKTTINTKEFHQPGDRLGYYFLTLPKGTIIQFRKMKMLSLKTKNNYERMKNRRETVKFYNSLLPYDSIHIWLKNVPNFDYLDKLRINVSLSDFNALNGSVILKEPRNQ